MQVLKSIWAKLGNWFLTGVIVAMAVLQPHAVTADRTVRITFGPPEAYAAGTADYSLGTNGTANTANITTAINALPSQGGLFQFKVGTYNLTQNASGPITRAFGNMTIEGEGKGTFFTGNASFTAGGSNWVFRNLAVNQTSMLPANCTWDKVYTPEYPNGISKDVNGVYSVSTLNATQVNGTTGNFTTLNAPTGRGAVLVAASDSPALAKSQADYICDGTADDVQIQAAIDSLPTNGGRVYLSVGTFTITSLINAGTKYGVDLVGQGYDTIITQPNNTNLTPFIYSGANSTIIEHIRFEGNGANQASGTITVRLQSGNQFVRNCFFYNSFDGTPSVQFDNAADLTIENNYFAGAGGVTSASGAANPNALHVTVRGNKFYGCKTLASGDIIGGSVSAYTIADNLIVNTPTNANAIAVAGTGGDIYGNNVTGTVDTYSIWGFLAGGYSVHDNTVDKAISLQNSTAPNYVYRNIGFITENSGNVTLAANTSIVTVTHGLALTPTWVGLTSTSNLTQWLFVSGTNATSFNITSSINVTANTTIYWRAVVGAGN